MLLPEPAVLGYLCYYTHFVPVCQGVLKKYFRIFHKRFRQGEKRPRRMRVVARLPEWQGVCGPRVGGVRCERVSVVGCGCRTPIK